MFVNKLEGAIPDKINLMGEPTFKKKYLNVGLYADVVYDSKDCWFFHGELMNPIDLPRNYFKEICCEMSLQKVHNYNLPAVVQTMSQLLVPRGVVHVTVPNYAFFALEHPEEEEVDMDMLERIRNASIKLLDPVLNDSQNKHIQNKSLWTPKFAEYLFNACGFTLYDMEDVSSILWFKAELCEV
jgi:hypothetical protein